MEQRKKAEIFRALHREPGTFVMPNAWDAGSARLLGSLGFKALATTSAGLAFALGRPDGENAVSREETLANARSIAEATALPVSADLEGGFGHEPEACAMTISMAAAAGLCGGSIEDATGGSRNPIHEFGLAVARVEAAVAAARALDFPFTLTARAENLIYGKPDLKDTIKRLQAFQEAGADVLFAPGLRTAEDIGSVVASVDRPVSVVMGLVGAAFSVEQLAQLGVKRISTGGSLARAAIGAYLRAAHEIAGPGTFDYVREAMPGNQLDKLFAMQGRAKEAKP